MSKSNSESFSQILLQYPIKEILASVANVIFRHNWIHEFKKEFGVQHLLLHPNGAEPQIKRLEDKWLDSLHGW